MHATHLNCEVDECRNVPYIPLPAIAAKLASERPLETPPARPPAADLLEVLEPSYRIHGGWVFGVNPLPARRGSWDVIKTGASSIIGACVRGSRPPPTGDKMQVRRDHNRHQLSDK